MTTEKRSEREASVTAPDDETEFGIGTRAEHLTWCKQRALQYVDGGDLHNAFASMCSDLTKHSGTRGHSGSELGMVLLMAGQLETAQQMREWIEGYR